MSKGGIETEYMLYVFFVAILVIIILALFFGKSQPLQSAEAESIRLSNQLSIFINSMSTIEEGEIEISIEHPIDIHIKHIAIFDSDRLKELFNSWGQFEFSEGFSEFFKTKGHYVIVTPYRDNIQKPFDSSLIISYPREDDPSLQISLLKPKKICIVKEKDKERAEVKEC